MSQTYIVLLKDNADQNAHIKEMKTKLGTKFSVVSDFSPILKSYATVLDAKDLAIVRADPHVETVTEANVELEGETIEKEPTSAWNLARISQKDVVVPPEPSKPGSDPKPHPAAPQPAPGGHLPPPPAKGPNVLPAVYVYTHDSDAQGQGVDVYVLDSGINNLHGEFEADRLKFLHNGFKPEQLEAMNLALKDDPKETEAKKKENAEANKKATETHEDLNGHGTHVSSVLAGKVYGVAKKATVYSVKVINGLKRGNPISVLNGLNAIFVAISVSKRPSVVCFSVGAVYAAKWHSVTLAIAHLVEIGAYFCASAGNDGTSVLNRITSHDEPGHLSYIKQVIVVGATNIKDEVAGFSNFGPRVDIFAPGVDIPGASHVKAGNPYTLAFGTSEANPQVAGLVACILSEHLKNKQALPKPEAIRDILKSNAVTVALKRSIPPPDQADLKQLWEGTKVHIANNHIWGKK